jgi:hypothetical protein
MAHDWSMQNLLTYRAWHVLQWHGTSWSTLTPFGLCQTFAKVFSKVAVVRRKAKKSKKVATFLGGRANVAGGARAEGYKFVRARKFLRF